ncbi:MAG: hypothetical protein EOO70_07090, partial [Myxococcaceae bacterium]
MAGLRALADAGRTGRRLAVVFADARDTANLLFAALLCDIQIQGDRTTFRFSHLRSLHAQTKTGLRLLSSGEALSPGFIRPYALVQTPDFLRRSPWVIAGERKDKEVEQKRAFLLHVNPRSGFSYEPGFEATEPLTSAKFLLDSERDHGWSVGNCWRMIREGDLLLFRFRDRNHPGGAAVFFAGQVSRAPFM